MFRSLLLVAALGVAVVACAPPSREAATDGELRVQALAGPVCPIETVPADPACEPRPVEGAPVSVSTAQGPGDVVAEGLTDVDGRITFPLPPGDYLVTAGDVEGLMGSPASATITIGTGASVEITLEYDTGIR